MVELPFDRSHGRKVPDAEEISILGGARFSPQEQDRFAIVRLRFETVQDLPLRDLSRSHPEIAVSMTAIQQLPPDRFIVEFEITTSAPRDFTQEIAHEPGVVSVILLTPVGPRSRYQMVINVRPDYVDLTRRLGALLRYPRIVRDGVHTVEVAATISQLRRLIEDLGKIAHGVKVVRFGRARLSACPPSLTSREYALLHQALADGYFDVPRRITLTAFAKKLGRSKSAVSRSLALVEEKLAHASVTTPG